MTRAFLTAGAISAALMAPAAIAHRGHDSLTMVTVADTGEVSVSHRFERHDLEPALSKIAPQAQPSFDDPEAVAALEAYLQRRFSLATERGQVALKITRRTLGASEIRIELGGRITPKVKTLTIRSGLLSDIYPSQVNQVNVRRGAVTRTLRFEGSATKSVTF